MKKIFAIIVSLFVFPAMGWAGTLSIQASIPGPGAILEDVTLVEQAERPTSPACEEGTVYNNQDVDRLEICRGGKYEPLNTMWTRDATTNPAHIYPEDHTDLVSVGYNPGASPSPRMKLSLDNDGGIEAWGALGSGATTTDIVARETGTRFLWYPRKSALRVGTVDMTGFGSGQEWLHGFIGEHSIALGWDTGATGIANTVSGGKKNIAFGNYTTVSGGLENVAGIETIRWSSHLRQYDFATVGGGRNNNARAPYSVIGGGLSNIVSSQKGFIGGGENNIIPLPLSGWSTIGGGKDNIAGSDSFFALFGAYCTVAGGGSNLAWGNYSTVGGGYANEAGEQDATISGGRGNIVKAVAGTISGGTANEILEVTPPAHFSTISGGTINHIRGTMSVIGGGSNNTVDSAWSTIGGGTANIANTTVNYAANEGYVTIAGGTDNKARTHCATIAGGAHHEADGKYSFVGGGATNRVLADYAVIPGGQQNTASGSHSAVLGGSNNAATGDKAVIAGGSQNQANGNFSFVSGGNANITNGDYSWVGGRNMQLDASADNTFVWGYSASTPATPVSTSNAFIIDPLGNSSIKVGIGKDNPQEKLDVRGSIRAETIYLSEAMKLDPIPAGTISCTSINDAGTIYYSNNGGLCFCRDTLQWKDLLGNGNCP